MVWGNRSPGVSCGCLRPSLLTSRLPAVELGVRHGYQAADFGRDVTQWAITSEDALERRLNAPAFRSAFPDLEAADLFTNEFIDPEIGLD